MTGDAPTSASVKLSNTWSSLVDAVGVTNFGDQAVVVPLAVGIALIFALSGWRRGALAWTAAIGSTLSLILFLKLRFFACDHLLTEARPGNPSGHTAAAAAVYGGLLAIAMRSIWDTKRWALPCTVAIAVFLAVVIGRCSRGSVVRDAGRTPFAWRSDAARCGNRPSYRIHALWISHNSRSGHQVGSHQSLAIPRMHLKRSRMEHDIHHGDSRLIECIHSAGTPALRT